MSTRQSGGLTYVDVITTTHRISGGVQPSAKMFSDVLNDRSQSFVLLSQVYVSRLDSAVEIGAHAPFAYMSKDNLIFVILPSEEVRPPEQGRYGIQEYTALATMPGFELEGRFVGPRRVHVRSFSPAALDPFLILFEARARYVYGPEIEFSGEAILLNRERLESLCLVESV